MSRRTMLAAPLALGAIREGVDATDAPWVESPLDDGEDAPPRPVRTLDPRNPVAVELARLYDVLRSTHDAEIRAKRDLYHHHLTGDAIPREDEDAWSAHCEKLQPLRDAEHEAERPRRKAYFALMNAVIEAHGGGTPWLSEYYRYGVAHRVVRVGSRVYSVASDYDSDWPEEEYVDDHGMVVLSVVDF